MDKFLIAADSALRTLFAPAHAVQPSPAKGAEDSAHLSPEEKRLAGALMRVNHVGEVCAQALYTAQAAVTQDDQLRAHLLQAAREETDHLAWTQQRLDRTEAALDIMGKARALLENISESADTEPKRRKR